MWLNEVETLERPGENGGILGPIMLYMEKMFARVRYCCHRAGCVGDKCRVLLDTRDQR